MTLRLQNVCRWLLGAFLVFAGLSHLTFARVEFLAQVPRWLPIDGDVVVVLSGLVEVSLGVALAVFTRRRVLVGVVTAAFFVAVFPGNLNQYFNHLDAFGLNSDTARFTRLFFQPVLVAWALWSTGAWQAWQRSRARRAS